VWLNKDSYIYENIIKESNYDVTNLIFNEVSRNKTKSTNILPKQVSKKYSNRTVKVAFIPDNLGQAIMMKNILESADSRLTGDFFYHNYVKRSDFENIEKRLQIRMRKVSLRTIFSYKPDLVLTCNDWNPANNLYILILKILGIKTVCLQESVIDFFKNSKMQYADYVLLQGVDSINYFNNRKIVFLTGNPRYVYNRDIPKNDGPIMINYNLFFHEFSKMGPQWLKDVLNVCDSLNLKYFISKHPNAILPRGILQDKVIHSNALSIDQQFSSCSFLITRFTSLIHEALLFGKNVIYYDPFNEQKLIGYDFKDKGNVSLPLIRVKNKKDLKKCVYEAYNHEALRDRKLLYDYLTSQTGSVDGLAARNCFLALLQIAKLSITTRNLLSLFTNSAVYPARKFKYVLAARSIRNVLKK
jgi:hypothetical protein